jgi:putative transcriptional regulator
MNDSRKPFLIRIKNKRMKMLPSLIVLLFIPFSVSGYIPEKDIAFTDEQLSPGRFLVAREGIQGGVFRQSVILLTHHDKDGDMGLIINRPTQYQVRDVYSGFSIGDKAGRLYVGGPVMNAVLSVLIKSKSPVEGTEEILPSIRHGFVSSSEAATRYFAADVDAVRFYSGYAGWGKGQLVNEVNRGGWYVIDGEPAFVLDHDADTLWQDLVRKAQHR